MNSFGFRNILAGTLLAAIAGPITSAAAPAADPQPEPHVNAAADEPKPVEPRVIFRSFA